MPLRLIAWHALSPAARDAVRALRVTPRQVEYAGRVETSIAACESAAVDAVIAAAADVAGLAMVTDHDDAVVGFVVMKRRAAAPGWAPPDAATVSALRIDASRQGQGLGGQALRALPGWVRRTWPAVRRIVLSVDEENEGARRAYERAGWVDDGVRVEGRIGPVRHMTLDLADDGRASGHAWPTAAAGGSSPATGRPGGDTGARTTPIPATPRTPRP